MWYNTSNLGSITSIAYAESTDGYTWQKPVEKNPILLNEIPGYFDYKGLSDGSVIVLGNTDLLWYGGAIISGISNIGLAYLGEAPVALPTPLGSLFPTVTPSSTQIPTDTPTPTSTPIPTTTPTLTPTPSPSPTLTPTPKKKKPVVIVPGMFSSWNKEAILEGKSNVKSMWKLLPFVHEYDGIVQTFKNLGYTENDTLFVYPYDWRKSILDSTALFGQFLSSQVFLKHPDDKIVIIGHSLGGLIARAWIQTGANKDKIDNLITVGSPNQGVIQPYRAWEGGDVSQDDSVISFAASVILHLNQSVLTTDRETVQKIFPVLKDLLPVAPYLIQKSDNSDINKNQMYVWNDFLEKLNSSVSSIYSFIDTVSGTGIDTPNKYIVSTPSKIDFLLGNWQDGKPENIVKAPGDGTVTQSRAIFSDDPSSTLLKNHGALITSREGIEKILQILAVDYTFEDIVEGKTTSFSHGLLFLLRSPATFTVSGNGSVYSDLDSILYIPDASAGEYTTTVVGTGSGTYHLSIGQYSTNGSTWTDITGTTEINKKDTYVVQYTPDSPLDKPIINLSGNDWLSQINAKLLELEKIADKQRIRRIRIELALTEKFLERKNYFIVGKQLEKLLFSLSDIREKSKAETATLTFETGDLVLSVYDLLLRDKPEYFPEKSLSHTVEFLDRTKGKIFKSIDKKKTDIKHILLYQKALNYFVMGKSAFVKSQFAKASIYFLQSKIVFNEVL
jgi:pimeloyl-ACP methyl ester carboxylesterase